MGRPILLLDLGAPYGPLVGATEANVRQALRSGANVICEKPLVINPWNLDGLEDLERASGLRISTVLQLRLHPQLMALRSQLATAKPKDLHDVCLTYITARGSWYDVSWKGSDEHSGGIATNIGIHFFDLLLRLFGAAGSCEVDLREPRRMAGYLELERHVKVVFDGPLVAAGHEDHLPHTGGIRLFHGILNQRFVDDRQHLLGLRFRRGQEAGAEAGHGEDRLLN